MEKNGMEKGKSKPDIRFDVGFFNILRLILAVTFIASGVLKALNPDATARTIIRYLSLLGLALDGIPIRLMAIGVCIGEILIGISACVRRVFHVISPVYVAVMAAFVILTYIDLTSSYGGLESCGCFGEPIHLNATETFIKNLVLLAISVTLCYSHIRIGNRFDANKADPYK